MINNFWYNFISFTEDKRLLMLTFSNRSFILFVLKKLMKALHSMRKCLTVQSVMLYGCFFCMKEHVSVTGKLTKIPKWDFIFARVKTGQVGT